MIQMWKSHCRRQYDDGMIPMEVVFCNDVGLVEVVHRFSERPSRADIFLPIVNVLWQGGASTKPPSRLADDVWGWNIDEE